MRKALLPFILVLALLVSCGDDDSDENSEDTTEQSDDGKSHDEASHEELEVWQKDLNSVGCWAGPVDGELGPETEAAIKAFQTAQGLTVDGLLGPNTEAALTEAAEAGERVCEEGSDDGSSTTAAGSSTTSGSGSSTSGEQASLTASGYDKDFTITSCASSGESSIQLAGGADGMVLAVQATDMTGSMSVAGGTEEDGIALEGSVTSVVVGDTGDFTVEGSFTGTNLNGEAFTLTGSCA